jgi:hypothetical protein
LFLLLGSLSPEIKALCDEEKSVVKEEIRRRKAALGVADDRRASTLSDVDWLAEKRKWLPQSQIQIQASESSNSPLLFRKCSY